MCVFPFFRTTSERKKTATTGDASPKQQGADDVSAFFYSIFFRKTSLALRGRDWCIVTTNLFVRFRSTPGAALPP